MNFALRKIDTRTYSYLREQAKKRGISMNELINNILNDYARAAEVKSIDNEYRAFANDILTLYKIEIEEDRRDSQMMMKELMDKLRRDEELHDEIKQFLLQEKENEIFF